ncbi:MAG TPA: SDR family NAD(P)-dependent oxidoreductase [Anaerolineaceae bacterium]|nr:SDR family NAD(P)-dependent oxidoreductase [Anaerolineaceae bacterium]HPN54046.1 SDR family NAD(P)-dependent oxidoreductase [Anaerolineaceae bacterium]
MDLHLSDKKVLITGASSGIGAASARVFAEEGADVILSYHRGQTGAAQAAEEVRRLGREARLLQMDLSKAQAISSAAEQLKADGVELDILVLCAGLNMLTPYQEITPEEWEKVLGINLNGSFYAIQAFAPLMRDGGAIVTVASVAAQTGAAHHMHYAAAKAGLVNLTKSAARALAPRLRVNCVAPGITLTPMGEDTIAAMPPDYAQKKLLVQRYATADEMARCIVFVASPVAGFMTGATVDINGGRELR